MSLEPILTFITFTVLTQVSGVIVMDYGCLTLPLPKQLVQLFWALWPNEGESFSLLKLPFSPKHFIQKLLLLLSLAGKNNTANKCRNCSHFELDSASPFLEEFCCVSLQPSCWLYINNSDLH